jgi:hypothetical protein
MDKQTKSAFDSQKQSSGGEEGLAAFQPRSSLRL